jgi:hypothetical protein
VPSWALKGWMVVALDDRPARLAPAEVGLGRAAMRRDLIQGSVAEGSGRRRVARRASRRPALNCAGDKDVGG